MRVAIIHDWLITYAGAERVLEQLLNCFPEADLFAVVEFLKEKDKHFIKNKEVTTSFIQNLPFSKKKYRSYLPFMPLAVEQFDMSQYDLVISSSHAVAKGIITNPNQIHICMCYTPIRYAWDLQHQYLEESKMKNGLKGFIAKLILHYVRNWDQINSSRVDHFISISKFISRRIDKFYNRESEVIYPPVDIDKFKLNHEEREDYYVTCSRMVPYKKIDLIVETFSSEFQEKKLIVIGDGPDRKKIEEIAGSNIEFLGEASEQVLYDKISNSRAFIFAAYEDFGIAPIEAQSCGTPVIAYGNGGALETIMGMDSEKPSGVFFKDQSKESLAKAVNIFEKNIHIFKPENCRENAERFSIKRFNEELKNFVMRKINNV
jgi:glycosyltransferase involved in cell wall biosynthesis